MPDSVNVERGDQELEKDIQSNIYDRAKKFRQKLHLHHGLHLLVMRTPVAFQSAILSAQIQTERNIK